MLFRSGLVLSKGTKSGTAKASGNPYRLTEYRVLVQNADLALLVVNELSDEYPAPHFGQGELVDVLVEVGVFRDVPSASYRADWVDVEPLALVS